MSREPSDEDRLDARPRREAVEVPDPWTGLRALTPANIAIGRVGQSLPTREILRFGVAHAQARDAVHVALDVERLTRSLAVAGWTSVGARSAAPDRATYLRRPDLGRRLAPDSAAAMDELGVGDAGGADLCVVIGDGLSAVAVQTHALPLLTALRDRLLGRIGDGQEGSGVPGAHRSFSPVVVATQARVALADEVAQRLRARMAVMLIGERPGLSSPDSLGIYLTWAPAVGRTDAERNCISNVRGEGLSYPAAARRLAWLIDEAFRRGLTGVALKDESAVAAIGAPAEATRSSPAGGT